MILIKLINNIKSIDNLPKETQELLEMTIKKEELQKQLEDESELKNSLEELENIVMSDEDRDLLESVIECLHKKNK